MVHSNKISVNLIDRENEQAMGGFAKSKADEGNVYTLSNMYPDEVSSNEPSN
jgi:hypothetical protein